MDYTTLKNRVFQKYYFNSYLPGSLGSYESSIIFNYLLALESIQENLTEEMNISERWIDSVPTWYTNNLPNLFFVHKFIGESDQEYLDRLLLLTNVNQNEETIIIATYSVVQKAVTNITNIQIIDKLDLGLTDATWGNVTNTDEWDGSKAWRSTYDEIRPLFLIDITIPNRGSENDLTTWDYWIVSTNYTKIQDMVKLYKPPGSTFELRLTPVASPSTIDVFTNTLLIWEGIHKVSDTTIYVPE